MRDLTIRDATQQVIYNHLAVTERLLARAASHASTTKQNAQIWAMPDLGFPNNVRRIHGGFFTGAVYNWTSSTPIVPIDATVNVCSVSVYRLRHGFADADAFGRQITNAIHFVRDTSHFLWNFNSGNHFVTYAIASSNGGNDVEHYLVLHSSASEFKAQPYGLYPVAGNWYSNEIKTVYDDSTGRYLRYVEGNVAETFYRRAKMLEEFNRIRHDYFANLISGEERQSEMVVSHPHYGMPTPSTVAIGCQWLANQLPFLLLTAPGQPLYMIRPTPSSNNQACLNGRKLALYPHGFGKEAVASLNMSIEVDALRLNGRNYSLHDSLADASEIHIRGTSEVKKSERFSELVKRFLRICPGEIIKTLLPKYSYSRSGFLYAENS